MSRPRVVDPDVAALAGHAIVAWALQVVHEHSDGAGWAIWTDDPDALAVDAEQLIAATESVVADARRWLHLAAHDLDGCADCR